MRPPEVCPNCGAEIPRNAKACPECGSDEDTGWSEEAHAGGLDLPDDNFDYDKFVEKEFGSKKPSPSGLPWFWWLVAVIVLAAFALLFIR
ncbi:MAG TPA: zinc ribbon domain-containing protein [Candidatus Paceibacterota bacterium]|nr:zinc ribbon domain-containing protein [Candidatus Paceibacterota bacterium]